MVSHVSPIKAATCWALGLGDQGAWRLYLATGLGHPDRLGCRWTGPRPVQRDAASGSGLRAVGAGLDPAVIAEDRSREGHEALGARSPE